MPLGGAKPEPARNDDPFADFTPPVPVDNQKSSLTFLCHGKRRAFQSHTRRGGRQVPLPLLHGVGQLVSSLQLDSSVFSQGCNLPHGAAEFNLEFDLAADYAKAPGNAAHVRQVQPEYLFRAQLATTRAPDYCPIEFGGRVPV